MFVTFNDNTKIFIPDTMVLKHKPTLLTLLAMIDCELSGVPATKAEILKRISADAGLSTNSGTTVYRALKKLQSAGLIYHHETGHLSHPKKIGRGGKTAPYHTIFTLEKTYDHKLR